MLELIETLRAHWLAEKIPIGPGATDAEITEFEDRYSVRLPPEIKLYFVTLGGMSDWHLDKRNFTFFPLRMVQSLSDFSGVPEGRPLPVNVDHPDKQFVIVDFLISSHIYLTRLSPGGGCFPVTLYTEESNTEVAPSFAAFLHLYLTNPDALF